MNFKRLKLNRNIINQTIVGYLGQEIFPVVSNKTAMIYIDIILIQSQF